jgi:hypothetical protein
VSSDAGTEATPPVTLPPWNVLAIVAFVLAFIAPPGGIACGHIARGQIRRTGEQGEGLALAGLIIGYVLTALVVVLVLVWLAVLVASLVGFVAIFSQIPHDGVVSVG